MNSHEKLKQKAIEVALTSEGQFRLGSVLARGRRIISTGTNISKSHPVQSHYAKKSGQPRRIHLHSEIRTLLRSKKSGDVIYVARVSKSGHSLRKAEPCEMCKLALKDMGVKTVFYSIDNHNWGRLNLND